jgi:hypothetical protein
MGYGDEKGFEAMDSAFVQLQSGELTQIFEAQQKFLKSNSVLQNCYISFEETG